SGKDQSDISESRNSLDACGEQSAYCGSRITRVMFTGLIGVSAIHMKSRLGDDSPAAKRKVVMNTANTAVTDKAWEAIQGAYDLQVHVAPDVIERRTDDIDLAKDFLARGLRGFVLKSHYIPTAERAKVVAKAVPEIESYGAIALNHSVGGLNPVAIE